VVVVGVTKMAEFGYRMLLLKERAEDRQMGTLLTSTTNQLPQNNDIRSPGDLLSQRTVLQQCLTGEIRWTDVGV
jgi:hypothetical protein